MMRMNIGRRGFVIQGSSEAPTKTATPDTKPSGSSPQIEELLTTRLVQLRNSLSEARTNVTSNSNAISELRTTADSLSLSMQEQGTRMNDVVSSLGEVEEELSSLSKKFQSVSTSAARSNNDDLQGKVDENSRSIEDIRSNMSELRDGLDAIPRFTDHSSDIARLGEENATQNAKIDSLDNDVTDVSSRVNRLSTAMSSLKGSTSSGGSLNEMFNNVSPMCSTVFMVFGPQGSYSGGIYSGSGCFITLSDNDLQHGIFLTCAHNLVNHTDNTIQYISEAYIENPLTNEWLKITPSMVFVDGVGDIALIKTGINFVGSKYKPLRLANEHAKTGDRCIVVGDPAMMDSDSMSCGIVRSARYEMKPIAYQINECLHTDAPTLGGSSGSPMLNEDGEIIAMLTYGHEGTSTFGGGPNSISIRKSLSVLAQFRDNREKKYLGLVWGVVYPITLARLKKRQPSLKMTTSGVQVYRVNTISPFYNVLYPGDIITEVETYDKYGRRDGPFRIGVHDGEVPLGFLLYEYDVTRITVTCISGRDGSTSQRNVRLSKTYADIANIYDVPLTTGLKTPLQENPLSD